MKIKFTEVETTLSQIRETYGKSHPAERYLTEAGLGLSIAEALLSHSARNKKMKEAKKQLKDSIKQLKENEKELRANTIDFGQEVFAKHLWSSIQAIQQSQHVYIVSGETKHDEELSSIVYTFLRGVPSVWDISETIDKMAEKKRKFSGGRIG